MNKAYMAYSKAKRERFANWAFYQKAKREYEKALNEEMLEKQSKKGK